jgi:hypothetical protein
MANLSSDIPNWVLIIGFPIILCQIWIENIKEKIAEYKENKQRKR